MQELIKMDLFSTPGIIYIGISATMLLIICTIPIINIDPTNRFNEIIWNLYKLTVYAFCFFIFTMMLEYDILSWNRGEIVPKTTYYEMKPYPKCFSIV